ncbi:MAG: hypothetical protein AAF938_15910 [Myxococcota bacterium]
MAATAAALFALFWISMGLSILFADYRNRRRVGPLSAPSTRIADLQDGATAKLVGEVRLGDATEEAPLSGRTCAAYRVRVDARRKLRWRALEEQRAAHGFFVNDGSGEVFVPADEHTELLLTTDGRFVDKPKKRASRALRRLLKPFRKEDPKSKMRCDEATLQEVSRVAVYGVFRQRPGVRAEDAADYRSRAYQFVAEPADEGLFVSDERGVIDRA